MTVTDHETTVLDDLDFAVPCEGLRCDVAAEHFVVARGLHCCEPTYFACSGHLARWREALTLFEFLRCLKHDTLARTSRCWYDARPLKPNDH